MEVPQCAGEGISESIAGAADAPLPSARLTCVQTVVVWGIVRRDFRVQDILCPCVKC